MDFSHDQRLLFNEIERRKAVREGPCESCHGSGTDQASPGWVCTDCMGQGILLTAEEYEFMGMIVRMTMNAEDDVLDAEYLELS